MNRSARLGWWQAGVALVLMGLAAWWLIPWGAWDGCDVPEQPARRWLDDEFLRRSQDYATRLRWTSVGSLATSTFLVAAIALWTPLRSWVVRRTGGPARALLALGVASAMLAAPWAWWRHQIRRDVGVSVQPGAEFWTDFALAAAINLAGLALAVLPVVVAWRKLPHRWPLAVGAWWGSLVVMGSLAYPVVIEPAFADFEPLADPQLTQQIDVLAAEQGVDLDEVLVSDAGARTTAINAYVSGLGQTRRVVLYDTALTGLSDSELLGVISHELAHAQNQDVWRGTALAALGAVLAAGLVGGIAQRITPSGHSPAVPPVVPSSPQARRLLARRHIRRPRMEAGATHLVVFLVAVAPLAGLVTSPITAGMSRAIEREADAVALTQLSKRDGGAEGLRSLQITLARRALLDPDPPAVWQWWFGSHPSTVQRLAFVDAVR